ncbi:hypothetical protein [Dactylosporangium darangshiense]|uniref:Uncharacterized protein n=1 Tax=Dactylosporangium darangshiense TaxID=579108 RepID=A0ABP8DIA9_9ACTN
MDRITLLTQTHHELLAADADRPAMFGALLLAIDTATAAADADPDHADTWDFCTLDLREAAVQLRPQLGDSVAIAPDLPPVDQVDARLSSTLCALLTVLAQRYRGTPAGLSHDLDVAVATQLDRAAAALS